MWDVFGVFDPSGKLLRSHHTLFSQIFITGKWEMSIILHTPHSYG